MTVSIVVIINHEARLQKTLEALRKQLYQDFEAVIVLTDKSQQAAALIETLEDKRFRTVLSKKTSLGAQLNEGFSNTQGSYRTWLSTDTLVTANWLSTLVETLSAYTPDVGCIMSYHAVTDQQGNIAFIEKNQRFDLPSLLLKAVPNVSFLYRTTLAKKVGRYDETLLDHAATDMWIRMASVSPAAFIEKVLSYHLQETTEKNSASDERKKIVDTFLLRTRGQFVIDYLFPSINLSKNPEFERFKARLYFGTLAFDTSEYYPVEAMVDVMTQALAQNKDENLLANIVHLYVKSGQWESAKIFIEKYQKIQPSPLITQLLHVVETKTQSALNTVPFLTMDENFLATDVTSSRTQKEILRHFASQQTKDVEENPGFFAQITTELVNTLNDGKDHPEIWGALSAFTSEKDQLRLTQLRSYFGALLHVPQDPKVMYYLAVLEAVCAACIYKISYAQNKLAELIEKNPDATAAKGALAYLTAATTEKNEHQNEDLQLCGNESSLLEEAN